MGKGGIRHLNKGMKASLLGMTKFQHLMLIKSVLSCASNVFRMLFPCLVLP